MAELTWTEEAQRWLEDIDPSIAEDNPSAAALIHGHFAYLIKSDGNIDILGVFHGALDISRYRL